MIERSEQREDRVADDAIASGWYRDPAAPETQRYWDGEEWRGEPIPADATPPLTPPTKPPATPPPGAPLDGAPAGTIQPAAPRRGTGAASEEATAPSSPAHPQLPGVPTPPAVGHPWQSPPVPPGTPGGSPPKLAGFPFGTPGYGIVLEFMATHRKAPLVRRVAARAIDFLAVLALNIVVNGWFVYQYARDVLPRMEQAFSDALAGRPIEMIESERATSLNLAIVVISVALWFAYEVPALAHDGQTFGKRLAGIRVARLDGAERLGFGTAFRRWSIMAIPNFLFPCGVVLQAIDCLWCTWDRPLEQCYHDKVARTAVVVQAGSDDPHPTDPHAADPPDRTS